MLAEAKSDVHAMPEKAKRTALASSSQFPPQISLTRGPLATIVDIRSALSRWRRTATCRAVLSRLAAHRLRDRNKRRAARHDPVGDVPVGRADHRDPPRHSLRIFTRGVGHQEPAADRHHGRDRPGHSLLGLLPRARRRRGDSGSGPARREIVEENTPLLLLHNVCDAYALSWKINDRDFNKPSVWMNAQGKQVFEYALWPHEQDWPDAHVPQIAWEYNCSVLAVPGMAVAQPQSFCETSANVLVEALRRDGDEIELRMVECLGQAGRASVRVNLPHTAASRTDLLGDNRQTLSGGPVYDLEVRPQEIVTLRLRTPQAVRRSRLCGPSSRLFRKPNVRSCAMPRTRSSWDTRRCDRVDGVV